MNSEFTLMLLVALVGLWAALTQFPDKQSYAHFDHRQRSLGYAWYLVQDKQGRAANSVIAEAVSQMNTCLQP